jgi:hypothetical protein
MAGITPGATDTNSTQYLIEQQVASAIPGPIGAIAADIVGIFSQAHAQAVKVEAQTLSAAVPQWRSLLASVVAAYNAGEISASQAISYIEEAKGIYYTQVKAIQHGAVPAGGVGASAYTAQHGRFAPFSPCNAACNIAYYSVEPEAQIVEAAINSGTAQNVDLLAIPILNTASGGVPASQLQIVPPVIASTVPGASAVNSVVAQAKSNPLVFGALALIGLVLIFKVIE